MPKILTSKIHKRRRNPSLLMGTLCFLFIMGWSTYLVEANLRPLVMELGENKVTANANIIIYKTVNDVLSDDDIKYDDLVRFNKTEDGKITALETDIVKINLLKSEIAIQILEKLNHSGDNEILIPIGSLISGDIWAGRGPNLPIKYLPIGNVLTSVDNIFTSAGINQTKHQIIMNITTDIGIALPGKNVKTKLNVPVIIAETVIVGEVPQSYTNVYGDNGDFIDKINNYCE